MTSVMAGLMSGLLLAGEAAQGGSFIDSLPDPMKPDLYEIGFIVIILILLHFFLKTMLFRPLGKLMDGREAEIQAGAATKLEASKTIDARQADYADKLKDLRTKAFEHRKELAQAATEEKAKLIDKARQDASSIRKDASDRLDAQRENAKSELVSQVDALADSMVQHLLKQA